jgi:hypothetical protein
LDGFVLKHFKEKNMKKAIFILSLSLAINAETIKMCQVDGADKPVQGKCFVITEAVLTAFNSFIADNTTTGTDADGNQVKKAKYASVHDLLVKHFIDSLVLPMLDRYPTPEVQAAKAAAKAAAEQADSAKFAALQ